MKGLFISGTSTGVGKTIASTLLMARARALFTNALYHKAIQTGSPDDDDARTIKELLKDAHCISRGIAYKKPLSPHLAAHYENSYIEMSSVISLTKILSDFIIVEGAGGLLVPLNNRSLIIDLVKRLEYPCVIVATTRLGTINHTLLSLEALRARRIPVHGIIMMGERNRDNEESIKHFGRITNLLALPWLSPVNHDLVIKMAEEYADKIDTFILRGNRACYAPH